MPPLAPKVLIVLVGLATGAVAHALAQDADGIAQSLNERVLFVTSGGFWEEASAPQGDADGEASGKGDSTTETAPTTTRRGYYRLVAIRGEDNRSLVELHQIALTPEGPQLALSIGLEEINALGAYVTDIRPEDSTGTASQHGFSAFIYLKTDPSATEPQTWALFVDEFGDIVVEKSSN
ncbi:hypothetical protein [Hoeflea sp.]|uniref:hypothetical protein n=1 Tax=Hoeflea sp. TaxID=1940281 RepID=UPI00374994E4